MPENGALHLIVDTDYLDSDTLETIKSLCERSRKTNLFAIGNGSGKNNSKVHHLASIIEGVFFHSKTVDCKPEAADAHIIFLIQELCHRRASNITLITRDRKLAEMAKRTGEIFEVEISIKSNCQNLRNESTTVKRKDAEMILSAAWQWLINHPNCGHQVPKNALQKIVQSANLPVNDRNIHLAREAVTYARQKQAKFDRWPHARQIIHHHDERGAPAPLMM